MFMYRLSVVLLSVCHERNKTMLNNIGEACTACRACEQICPNSAIIFEKDEYGNIYPQVLEDKCTWCGLCNSVCHVQKYSFITYDNKILCWIFQ